MLNEDPGLKLIIKMLCGKHYCMKIIGYVSYNILEIRQYSIHN